MRNRPDFGWRRRSVFGLLRLRPPEAQHTEAEAKLLVDHARGRKALVEIGVAEGASALLLREAMDPDGVLTLIDPYWGGEVAMRLAKRVVGSSDRGRVKWIRAHSQDVRSEGSIDFLFLDGDHSDEGVRRDFEQWTVHVAPDGVVALHDALPYRPSGPPAVLKEALEDGWELVGAVDSTAVIGRSA